MLLLLLLFIINRLNAQSLIIDNTAISPSYAGVATATYQFDLISLNVTIANGYTFSISFPTNSFSINVLSSCQWYMNGINFTLISCAYSNNIVTFSNVYNATYATPSNITIKFSTNGAVYSTSPILSMYFSDSNGNQISSTYISAILSVSVASAVGCSVQSSSSVTGVANTWNISLAPLVAIQSGQLLQLVLPLWGVNSTSNFVNSTPICSTTNCSSTISGSFEYLTIYGLFNQSSTANVSANISNIRNPSNTYPISIVFNIITSNSYKVQNCSTSFSANTPNTFRTISFINSNLSISATNSIVLSFSTNNPLPSTAYLGITTSLTLSYSYTAVNSNKPFKTNATDGSTLLLANITSSNLNSGFPLQIGTFTLTNPPYSNSNVTISFTTEVIYGGNFYKIDSSTVNIYSNPSTITSYSLVSSNSTVNILNIYSIKFTIINPLPYGSVIVVVIPVETTTNSNSTCLSSYSSCTINNKTITIIPGVALSSGANITFNITNITNPSTTSPSSSFTISTYYSSQMQLVDQLTNGFTITASPVMLTSTAVYASNYTVMQSSVSYTFVIQCTNPVPINTIINITFPVEITTTSAIAYASNNTLPCSILNISQQSVLLTGCIQVSTTQPLSITLSTITNPLSQKPTSTFNVTTYYNNNLLQYLSQSLSVTMTTPSKLSLFSVTPSPSLVNSVSSYSFLMTFGTVYTNGSKVYLNFPTQILIGSGFQCNALIGVAAVSCVQNSTTNLIVTLTFATFPTDYKIQFSITNFTNNWKVSNSIIACQTTTNDLYAIQASTYSLTFVAATLTLSVNNDQNIILLGNSTIKLNVTSPYIINMTSNTALTYLVVQLPSTSFTVLNSGYSSSYGSIASYNNGFNISNINTFSSTISITLQASTLYFNSTSDPITCTLYYNASVIAINTISINVYCTSPCGQCTATPTQCLSCLPPPYTLNNTYLSSNNSCTQTCPNGTFFNTTTTLCVNCTGNCLTCVTNSSNCLTCNSGYYFLNNTCYQTCPATYFANSTNCSSCVFPCVTCSSQISCLTCGTGYYFYNNTCQFSCADITTVPINGSCVSCSGVCYTCSVITTNCTSCKNSLILYNYSCYSSCPATTYLSGTNCLLCLSPCATCISALLCSSCISTYYLYNSTSCVLTCPSGTIASSTSQCVACSTECLSCAVSVNNCSSCASNMFSVNNTCVSSCSIPYYPYDGKCVTCISPCSTCSGTPFNCSSCVSHYYLYNNTSCLTSCPQTYYLQISTSVCQPCSADCINCVSLSNCSTCISTKYSYNGLCYSTCPASNPIIIGQSCTACSVICLTCSLTINNCTSCPSSLYQYEHTCLTTCPLGMASNPYSNICYSPSISYVVVYFPCMITLIVVTMLVGFSKLYNRNTAFITSFVGFGSIIEIVSWAYFLSTVTNTNDQPAVNNTLPIILTSIAFVAVAVLNIVFLVVNPAKNKPDPYFTYWINSTRHNYYTYISIEYLSLVNLKVFRTIYSRIFNLIPLSLIFMHVSSIFPHTNLLTLLCTLLCELPVIASTLTLIYYKNAKDQLYYNCIDCLLVTSLIAIMGILDMYKQDEYFQESEFLTVKKYLDHIKDSMKKESDQMHLEAPINGVDSEKFVRSHGYDGTHFMLGDEQSINNLNVNSQDQFSCNQLSSQLIDFPDDTIKTVKKHKRINIFEAVLEQEAEYQSDYSEDSLEVAVAVLKEKRIKSEQNIVSDQANIVKNEIQNDTQSLMEHGKLKKQWKILVEQRRNKARELLINKEIQTVQKIEQMQQEQDEIAQAQKQVKQQVQFDEKQQVDFEQKPSVKSKDQEQQIDYLDQEVNQKASIQQQQQQPPLEKIFQQTYLVPQQKQYEQRSNDYLTAKQKEQQQPVTLTPTVQVIEYARNSIEQEPFFEQKQASRYEGELHNTNTNYNSFLPKQNSQQFPLDKTESLEEIDDSQIIRRTRMSSMMLTGSMKKTSEIYLQRLKIPQDKSKKNIKKSRQKKVIKAPKGASIDF